MTGLVSPAWAAMSVKWQSKGRPDGFPRSVGFTALVDTPCAKAAPPARQPRHVRRDIDRRTCLGCLAGGAAFAQGESTRAVKPTLRGKPSGLPFDCHFTDIAAQAGLTSPVIYGGINHKDYILEVVGCGVALFDFDNDGWLDILLLSGTRFEGTPDGASNRL